MLFKEELAQLIVRGKKTQTRRPFFKGDVLWNILVPSVYGLTKTGRYRLKMAIGKDYSVQYKYGKPCRWWHPERRELIPYNLYMKKREHDGDDWENIFINDKGWRPLRLIITDIRKEDVRNISHEDAIAEGFLNRQGFWNVWCGFYDKKYQFAHKDELMARNDDKYQAWAYSFSVKGS